LGRAGRYQEVVENLKVKEVWVEDRRSIVCSNRQEAAKDAADRQAILTALEDNPEQGAKSMVGNRGYRRFLKVERGAVSLDVAVVAAEARCDGKYVLCTNTTLPAAEVAVQHRRLYLVEQLLRAAKSLFDTRPIFHQWDATIKGHVFCPFLALVLLDELKRRLSQRGWQFRPYNYLILQFITNMTVELESYGIREIETWQGMEFIRREMKRIIS
jgi:hypothetical protein